MFTDTAKVCSYRLTKYNNTLYDRIDAIDFDREGNPVKWVVKRGMAVMDKNTGKFKATLPEKEIKENHSYDTPEEALMTYERFYYVDSGVRREE